MGTRKRFSDAQGALRAFGHVAREFGVVKVVGVVMTG